VAEQIVSNERKFAARYSAPCARSMASPTRSAMASDSRASIVVWLATPTRARCSSGSKSGEAERANLARNAVAVAATGDVVAHELGLGHVAHHEVVAVRVLLHLAGGGARLLVVVLAVDERGEAVARVGLDALPHVEHRAARGVDHHAAEGAQGVEVVDGHAERRQDHHVLGATGA
jgi:hypothetical protein